MVKQDWWELADDCVIFNEKCGWMPLWGRGYFSYPQKKRSVFLLTEYFPGFDMLQKTCCCWISCPKSRTLFFVMGDIIDNMVKECAASLTHAARRKDRDDICWIIFPGNHETLEWLDTFQAFACNWWPRRINLPPSNAKFIVAYQKLH